MRSPRLTTVRRPLAPPPLGIPCPLQVEKTGSGKRGASSGRCSFTSRLRGWDVLGVSRGYITAALWLRA